FKGLALPSANEDIISSSKSNPSTSIPQNHNINQYSSSQLNLDSTNSSDSIHNIPYDSNNSSKDSSSFLRNRQTSLAQRSTSASRNPRTSELAFSTFIDPSEVPQSKPSEISEPPNINQLELGLEYSLNIRQEDLKTINELGSGASGTVSKVLHIPTNTQMAMKVSPSISLILYTPVFLYF
ncbi:Dual specificity protein kinase FUZ7, partial [Smittium culicis]